jgi:large subunit ribosomal protein L10
VQKTDKQFVIDQLTERLKTSETLIVADYRGLTNKQLDAIRDDLYKHGAKFSVAKNTLARRAAEAAGADALLALLEGPTAIAFVESGGDPVAVAKALSDAARTTKILAIRGGVLQGKTIGEEEIKSLATLPPVETLRAQALGAMVAPLTTFVALINAPLQNLIGLIDARIEQLGGAGDTAVAPAAPAETEAPAAAAAAPVEAEAAPAAEPAAEEPAAAPAAPAEAEAVAEQPVAEAEAPAEAAAETTDTENNEEDS